MRLIREPSFLCSSDGVELGWEGGVRRGVVSHVTNSRPRLAVDRREVFLLLFLVETLNLDNGSVEVPELYFLTPE